MSQGVYVLVGRCPGGEYPGGKCLGGICHLGKCPGGTCQGRLFPRILKNIFHKSLLVTTDTIPSPLTLFFFFF